MASEVPVDYRKLFQRPPEWTPQHLLGLNIQEHHRVPAAVIVGAVHLSSDDNPLFMDLAGEFSKPNKQELFYKHYPYPNNKLQQYLYDVLSALDCFERAYPPYSALYNLAMRFGLYMDRLKYLNLDYLETPFNLPSLSIKGSLKGKGAYFSCADKECSFPLAIFIARKGPENQSAAHEVVPYLLFQVLLVHERNPYLGNYTALVVCMKGTNVQFLMATCSKLYIQDLISNLVPRTPLEIHFSEPYDLVEQDGRREFVRIYLGLIECLYDVSRAYNL